MLLCIAGLRSSNPGGGRGGSRAWYGHRAGRGPRMDKNNNNNMGGEGGAARQRGVARARAALPQGRPGVLLLLFGRGGGRAGWRVRGRRGHGHGVDGRWRATRVRVVMEHAWGGGVRARSVATLGMPRLARSGCCCRCCCEGGGAWRPAGPAQGLLPVSINTSPDLARTNTRDTLPTPHSICLQSAASHIPFATARGALETTSLRLKLGKQVQLCIFSNSNACSAKPQRQIS